MPHSSFPLLFPPPFPLPFPHSLRISYSTYLQTIHFSFPLLQSISVSTCHFFSLTSPFPIFLLTSTLLFRFHFSRPFQPFFLLLFHFLLQLNPLPLWVPNCKSNFPSHVHCHFPLILPLLEVQNILRPILGHEIVVRKATPLRHRELMVSREVLLKRGVL
jgi:hypothetical protein